MFTRFHHNSMRSGVALLAMLLFDVFLACAAEQVGLRTPDAESAAEHGPVMSRSEDGKDRLIASLRKPEFLGAVPRTSLWNLPGSILSAPTGWIVPPPSGHLLRGAAFELGIHFQPRFLQIFLCVWLI